MQKKLGINIKTYKRRRGVYKKGEKTGKGKEYYNGKLIFEGEYLNGEGKEYDYDGDLLFEGEYLNGKRWNGEGYYKEGEIDFKIKEGNGKGKDIIIMVN